MNKSINYSSYFTEWGIIAGPCSAESELQVLETAAFLKQQGVVILRAGVWKPRTNPEDWQGPGDVAMEWLKKAKQKSQIAVATEVKDEHTFQVAVEAGVDVLWVGSRNAQNFSLLEYIGKATKVTKQTIILKRAMSASLVEWLGAARYITRYNPHVVLCERGVRGYSPDTRNILDLQTAYLAKMQSGLPVIVDVSHAAGRTDLIIPMARAVKAAGFNGLMVEVHPDPKNARTDSLQQIDFGTFSLLSTSLALVPAV